MHSCTSMSSDSPGSPTSAMCAPAGPAIVVRNAARSSWCCGARPDAATRTAPTMSPIAARQRARRPGWLSGSADGWPNALTTHTLPSKAPSSAMGPGGRGAGAGSAVSPADSLASVRRLLVASEPPSDARATSATAGSLGPPPSPRSSSERPVGPWLSPAAMKATNTPVVVDRYSCRSAHAPPVAPATGMAPMGSKQGRARNSCTWRR
jgi:hypothetical protein